MLLSAWYYPCVIKFSCIQNKYKSEGSIYYYEVVGDVALWLHHGATVNRQRMSVNSWRALATCSSIRLIWHSNFNCSKVRPKNHSGHVDRCFERKLERTWVLTKNLYSEFWMLAVNLNTLVGGSWEWGLHLNRGLDIDPMYYVHFPSSDVARLHGDQIGLRMKLQTRF